MKNLIGFELLDRQKEHRAKLPPWESEGVDFDEDGWRSDRLAEEP